MIIQNEPKKIAVTEAQISALRNAYKPQMVQANEVVGTPETNENIINNIVNTPAPEVVNTPGADALVTDAPKEEQARIVEKVDELMQLCDKLENENANAQKYSSKLLQSIMQKYFTPEV